MIGEAIAKANATLPDVQQVKRYLLLNKELDADDAEMTRTRKVRRRFVAEKYASVIEAFYGGASSADVTMEITFEDGRKSTLNSTIAIHGNVRRAENRRATRSVRLAHEGAGGMSEGRRGGMMSKTSNSSSPSC